MDTNPTITSVTTTSSTPVSPWVSFLTGRNVSADRFLRDVEDGVVSVLNEATGKAEKKKTHVITIPDETTRTHLLDVLMAKPERIGRLVLLLQACRSSRDTVRRIVAELAEAAIKRLGVIPFSETRDLDATAFRHAVSSWLAGVRKKPLKPAELNVLFLLLHFGWYRKLLDEDTAFHLVTSAVSNSSKPRPTKANLAKSAAAPIEALLAASPSGPVLSSLVAHHKASKMALEEVNAQLQSQAVELGRLNAECARLNGSVEAMHAEIAMLEEQKGCAETKIVELEKQVMDIHDGYQHKLNDLRGHVRGMLQGSLRRWLQTAFDASYSNPPWTKAIQERLEDALKLIEKEVQWLQPSA